MVERKVTIEIINKEVDGEKEELKTTGIFTKRNISEYVEYIDKENIKNGMKIERDIIYLTKYTTPTTNMMFKENGKYDFKYQTPFGEMDITIITKKLKVENEGYNYLITMIYDMIIAGEATEKNIVIKIY